jgi:hypothetical protein
MNFTKLALLSGLVLIAGVAFAGEPSFSLLASEGYPGGNLAYLTSLPANPAAKPSVTADVRVSVIQLAPIHIGLGNYPRYSELTEAMDAPGLLEPCALEKIDVTAKRRYDLFLAPIALNNGAAGFGIVRVSW